MRPAAKIFLACLLIGGAIWGWSAWQKSRRQEPAAAQVPAADRVHALLGVGLEYVLTPERCAALGGAPGNEFDVTPNQSVVASNGNGLLEITTTSDGIQADRLAEKTPDSFSLDGQGSVLSISGRYFGQLESGEYSRAVPLPYSGMRLMGSSLPGVAYLIGGQQESAHRVYAFFSDGTLQIEAEVPEPVVAVADNQSAVYLATSHAILRVTANDIAPVFRLPASLDDITSLAVAADDKALYFATAKETFVLSGLSAVRLLQDLGGVLRMRNDRLYVWSLERQILVSVSGMRDILAQAQNTQ
ncbi:MAG TPA: hypothetical protein VFQ41_24430 [Candidatus Angelobacter sp.]|nr:hypothetical protein [Candidatus Angelobacter sp.]